MQPESRDRELLESLVREHWGHPPRALRRVPAGLGDRRFYRVELPVGAEPTRGIARIEPEPEAAPALPPPLETGPTWLPEPALEPLRTWLEEAGIPVPRSLLHAPEHGIEILEDAGDRTLADAAGDERVRLYRAACDLVPRLQALHAHPETVPAFGRVFDPALVRTKAWKWIHWAIPGLLGRPARPAEARAIDEGFEAVARLLASAPRRLAHRDYKAENLHLQPAPDGGPERLVLIDLQGAFLAPPEYDLVCLLRDLQVDLPESFVQARLEETRPQLPDAPAPEEAALRFEALALVRGCKDVSHVVHAGTTLGDRRRWHEVPRGLDLVDRAARRLADRAPELAALGSVIQALTRAARETDSRRGGSDR